MLVVLLATLSGPRSSAFDGDPTLLLPMSATWRKYLLTFDTPIDISGNLTVFTLPTTTQPMERRTASEKSLMVMAMTTPFSTNING